MHGITTTNLQLHIVILKGIPIMPSFR